MIMAQQLLPVALCSCALAASAASSSSALAGVTATEDSASGAAGALAIDEECRTLGSPATGVATGACALNALQMRGVRSAAAAEGAQAVTHLEGWHANRSASGGQLEGSFASSGSCSEYGCVGYMRSHACQCNSECRKHGNCCRDFEQRCGHAGTPSAEQPSGGSCAEYGCVGYVHGHACQCNSECRRHKNCCRDFEQKCGHAPAGHRHAEPTLATPPGVNLGGWLCLEDWFFSGASGRNVMTPGTQGQGRCFPPKVPSKRWSSEGLLTKQLSDSRGMRAAAAAFEAHRRSYMSDGDLRSIAALGIKTVRLPLTWAAFADALASMAPKLYGVHNPEKDTWIVPDPFYTETTAWATIPRALLADFARQAGRHGLKVLFDLHAFPGGSSDATYSGVWPQRPAFWTGRMRVGDRGATLRDCGLLIAKALVQWVEQLGAEEQVGIAGVSLMNEPAHMAAMAKEPWADERQILSWLAAAGQIFRESQLPRNGQRLYVQVVDTAFKDFLVSVTPWWPNTFSFQERHSWAVIDLHWYAAWLAGKCDGRTIPGGGFLCDQPLDEVRPLLRRCADKFSVDFFASHFEGNRACSEMSVGTYEDGRYACTDRAVLRTFLQEQVASMQEQGIEPFFWTWRMPYASVFEPGWSLKHLAGLEDPHAASFCHG